MQAAGAGLPISARRRFLSAWPARGGEGRVRLVFDAESAEILAPELEFLVRRGVPETMLREALRRAALNGTAATQELFALGFDKRHYWSLLADDLGLVFLEDLAGATPLANAGMLATEAVRIASSALARIEDATILLLAPRPAEILVLRRRLQATPALSARLRIAMPDAIRGLIATRRHQALTHYAVNRLARALPQLSSGCERPAGIRGHKALGAALVALALVAPLATLDTIWLLFTLFFLNCSYWKLAAAFRRTRALRLEPVSDGRLPRYSVLVPLYREAAVVSELVDHLSRLDYPALCIKSTTRPLARSATIHAC